MPRQGTPRPGRLSLYPKIPFYIAIFFQLLSSLAVAGIMFYFIGHLTKQGFKLPWMFYFVSTRIGIADGRHGPFDHQKNPS